MKNNLDKILLLAAASLFLFSCENDDPVQPVTGNLEGYVYELSSGGPLQNAAVSSSGYKTFTSADGRYLLEQLPDGPAEVIISKPGYREITDKVDIEAGRTKHQDYRLDGPYPVSDLSGYVYEENSGALVPDAVITINGKMGVSDSSGYYFFENIIRGTYNLTVTKKNYFNFSHEITLDERHVSLDIILENACDGIREVMFAGQTYTVTAIDSQCWFKENLNIGTMIPGNQDADNNNIIEKHCYDNNPDNCVTYAGLYSWDEAMRYDDENTQGICPDGWHIPSFEDFAELIHNVEGDGAALKVVGAGPGTNSSGFSALIAGARENSGRFIFMNENTGFWNSSRFHVNNPFYLLLFREGSDVSLEDLPRNYGLSVRCIRDRNEGQSQKVRINNSKNLNAHDLNLPGINGNNIRLSEIPGKKLLLFYTLSCNYCIELIAELRKIYESGIYEKFEVYAVCLDEDEEQWKEYISGNNLKWTNVIDLNNEAENLYRVYATPTAYLLGNNNLVISESGSIGGIKEALQK